MRKSTKKKIIRTLIAALLILIITLPKAAETPLNKFNQSIQQNTPGYYHVTRFDDGDTILVNMEGKEEKIRLIGVDTPETKDPRKPIQCYGKAASEFTKKLINTQPVRLEADPTNSNRDRYQRLLRYVYLSDNTLVNKQIIEQGYGFAMTGFPFTKMEEFKQAQATAREENRGLWSNCKLETSSGREQTAPE